MRKKWNNITSVSIVHIFSRALAKAVTINMHFGFAGNITVVQPCTEGNYVLEGSTLYRLTKRRQFTPYHFSRMKHFTVTGILDESYIS